jgi:hypothetical protein
VYRLSDVFRRAGPAERRGRKDPFALGGVELAVFRPGDGAGSSASARVIAASPALAML